MKPSKRPADAAFILAAIRAGDAASLCAHLKEHKKFNLGKGLGNSDPALIDVLANLALRTSP